MSSTGRKKKDGTKTVKREADFYASPLWTIRSLLNVPNVAKVFNSAANILEPCCGDMAVVQAVDDVFPGRVWEVAELRAEEYYKILAFKASRDLMLAGACPRDFLTPWELENTMTMISQVGPIKPFNICITNPPFTIWEAFAEKAIRLSDHTFFLLRLGVLGSKKRFDFWQAHNPDIYILRDRPSFTNDGQTDSDYYAWFHFHEGEQGRWQVIA